MPKTITTKVARVGAKHKPRRAKRIALTGKLVKGEQRFVAVMRAAEESGLLGEKTSRIASRISPALIEQAKKQTGIDADTDLIEFALASVALEDRFAKAFRQARGKVDQDLKLGF